MKFSAVLRIVQPTMLVVTALTSLLQFQEVHSLPISARPGTHIDVASNSLAKDLPGHVYSDGETENGIMRVARDIGLVQENETATGVIYHANEREYTWQLEGYNNSTKPHTLFLHVKDIYIALSFAGYIRDVMKFNVTCSEKKGPLGIKVQFPVAAKEV